MHSKKLIYVFLLIIAVIMSGLFLAYQVKLEKDYNDSLLKDPEVSNRESVSNDKDQQLFEGSECPNRKIYKEESKYLGNFIIVGNKVCYATAGGDQTPSSYTPFIEYIELIGRDAESFKVLYEGNIYIGDSFTSDKNGVYYDNKLIIGADPDSFTFLPAKALQRQTRFRYGKDKNGAYFLNSKIPNADPDTFEILGYGYARDKGRVFFGGSEMIGVDSKTFVILDKPTGEDNLLCDLLYVKDKNTVFLTQHNFTMLPIPEADPESFVFLGSLFGRDNKNIFEGVNVKNIGLDDLEKYRNFCPEFGMW